jgi:hypothetical protein
MLRRLLALPIALALITAAPAGTAAAGAPDQAQMGHDWDSAAWGGVQLAQTFVTEMSGGLDSVKIYDEAYSPPNSNDAIVQIRTVNAGGPTSTVLASQAVTLADGWNTVTFANPALVAMSTMYAIVVLPDESVIWNGSCTGDPYPDGQALVDEGDGFITIADYVSNHELDSDTYCVSDFAFQTFVTPDSLDLNGTAAPDSPVAGEQTPMSITWTVSNNGIVPTTDHVWIYLVGTINYNVDSVECNPTAICSQLENPAADLGVMAPGDLATITLHGTYDASGASAGDNDGLALVACITSGPSNPDVRPNKNVRPNETIDLGNDCFGTEALITVAAPGTSNSPDPSASGTSQATLPPTSSFSGDRPEGSSLPILLLALMAAAGLLVTRGAVKRSRR